MIRFLTENITVTKETDDKVIRNLMKKYPKQSETLEKFLTNGKKDDKSK